MCWVLINCISSICGSDDRQAKTRIEAIGPNRQDLLRLQQNIYSRVSQAQITVSIFESKNPGYLQVLMYKRGNTIQIYKGSSEADYDEISLIIANHFWFLKA
jgi:hypothetical protein